MSQKILIVEDEAHLGEGLKYNLEKEGYEARLCETAEEAQEIYSQFDMMILDVMLPGMSGFEFLKKVRKEDNKFSVLILSAKSTEEDLLEGLSAGADDYMTKPFSLVELMLRIKRILERQDWYNDVARRESSYSFSKFTVNFDTFEATTNKGETNLTQYECYVMRYLIENKERGVSREELLEKVWGLNKATETRTVDMFIGRLRKLFEDDTKKPKHLQSIRGVGYRFFD